MEQINKPKLRIDNRDLSIVKYNPISHSYMRLSEELWHQMIDV